jgi:hypothetical protein
VWDGAGAKLDLKLQFWQKQDLLKLVSMAVESDF